MSFSVQCAALNIQTCSASQSSKINFNVTTLILARWLLNWFNYRILLTDIDQPSLKGGVYPCNWLWCISSRRGTQWCGLTRTLLSHLKGKIRYTDWTSNTASNVAFEVMDDDKAWHCLFSACVILHGYILYCSEILKQLLYASEELGLQVNSTPDAFQYVLN